MYIETLHTNICNSK